MIEIKCNEAQKEKITIALARSQYCFISNADCEGKCFDCAEKNIKWVIEEGGE
jgi:hypothetical protein